MVNYKAGSVTAEIILDTSEFDTAISRLKEEIATLKTTFNDVKGSSSFAETVKKLKEDIDSLKKTNDDYKTTIKQLREENENLAKSQKTVSDSVKKETESLKTTQKELDNTVKRTKRVIQVNKELGKSFTDADKRRLMHIRSDNANRRFDNFSPILEKHATKVLSDYISSLKKAGKDVITVKGSYGNDDFNMDGLFDPKHLQEYLFKQLKGLMPEEYLHTAWNKASHNLGLKYNYTGEYIHSDSFKEAGNEMKVTMKEVEEASTALKTSIKEATEAFLKEFSEATKEVKRDSVEIKNALNEIAQGASEVNSSVNKTKSVIENAKKANEALSNSNKKVTETVKEEENAWNSLVNTAKKATEALSKINSTKPTSKTYSNNWEVTLSQIEQATQALTTFERGLKSTELNYRKLKSMADIFDPTISELENAGQALVNLEKIYMELANEAKIAKESISGYAPVAEKSFVSATEGAERYRQKIAQMSAELRKHYLENERYYASVGAMSWKYWRQIRNSTVTNPKDSITGKSFSQSTFNAQTVGLQDYYANIVKVQEAVAKLNSTSSQAFKEQLTSLAETLKKTSAEMNSFANNSYKVVNSMNIMGKSNEVAGEISRISQNLNHFSSISNKNKESLSKLSQQMTILKDKFRVLDSSYRKGEISAETYDAELTKLAEKLKLVGASAQKSVRELSLNNKELSKTEGNVRKAGRGLTSFNNGVVQTAHSGRILSNTLYQIRGALLSLKMIFTAMGGMMLWGFAMDMAESVKTTVTAKNEMEAQLNQRFTNKKTGEIDTASIQYFRKELDKLPNTFKKVNKYSIGETVSSIGLEFDLTAKQMKDALPIVTMVQSEYVRAGRKEDEAALAVKDILQGEFQRLSRETGIGKEELIAYGWDEDKENIDGLLQAVKKAGLARHWDTFAKKATSLNDVLTITKSRFSELGAELMDSVTPMIVSAFNWITDSLSGLQSAFGSLDSFWQNFAIFGGGTALFGGILTVLPMITKGMGLADIATLGWSKSIGTAVLNLNKAEVAQYGFRKALASVIAGTKASELSEVRWTKAIAGRVLGLNQAVLAEQGYMGALVHSKMQLKGHLKLMESGSVITGNFRQKLIYLAKGELVADKASATWGKTIKSLITSLKLWRIAIMGVIGVGLIAWLSSVAMWTDTVKGRVEKYNHVLAEGKDEIKSMQKNVDTFDKRLSEMSKSDKDYNIISQNKATLEHNLESMKMAYKYAKDIKKETKEQSQIHKGMISRGVEGAYETAGVDNLLERNNIYQEMKYVAYDLQKAEEESYKFNYQSLQHINEKVGLMKQDADIQAKGIKDEKERAQFEKDAQDARVKYITEYSLKAEEASKHLKEFNEGNLEAGIYYLLDRLSLAWIDLWNDNDFVTFWRSVKQTWDDLKPTLEWLKDTLLSLGRTMAQFFSTDTGRWVGAFALIGGAVLGLAWKFRGVLGTLKDLGTTIWDRIKDFRGLKKSAEEASEKMEETGTTTGTTSPTSKAPTSWKETKGLIKQDFMANARSFANNATKIAMAMGYLTVAIATLSAPMLALAVEGELFKRIKPQVLSGVEGLKTIAPVVVAFMIPATALMVIFDKYKVSTAQMTDAFKNSAVGIALAITLVAEAIFLLNVPLLSLAILGQVYGKIESSVQEGVKAIRATTDALGALMPWIPVFIAGIALAGITLGTEGVGGIAILAVAGGIAVAIGLVTEAIALLFLPLEAIKELGEKYSPDLPSIRKGAEALKITGEALGYVEQGMSAFAGIAWASLSEAVAKLVGIELGVDLTQLTGEGGFFKQLETFTDEFNKISITPIDTDKVATLKESATGIDTVKTALNTVKDALKDLPNFNVDNRSTNEKYQDAVGGKETTEGITNYFEQLKEPITQLNEFIGNFNQLEIEPVEPDQVTTLQNSANAITTIQTAIEAVKNAVSAGVDAQWNSNVQTSGILGAGINLLVGNAGQSSSIKGSLDELYNCVKDIMDFNTRISGLTSEGSGDTSGIQNSSNMVSALQTQINSLKTTLSGAIPTIQSTAKGMGTAIVTGFQSGLTGVDSTAKTAGESIGTNLKSGFETNFKIKDVTTTEIDNTLTYLDGKKQSFYDKGKALGDALSQGYKDGQDIHSPGIIARSTSEELGRVEDYLSNAQINLPQLAYNLGNSISSNFNFDLGLSNIQLPDFSQFQQGLSSVVPMVTGVKDSVSLQFDTMKTNIGGAFSGILSNTKLNMGSMLSATTKNIGAIRTSWKGMQSALISSAEYIKTQTGQKIDKLKTNMGDFWNKIKHPDQLIGSAGGHQGTIRRRYGGSSMLKGLYAGGTSSKTPNIKFDLQKYLECMMDTGGNCYAGGWSFNWNKPIQNKFNGWNTHFGKYKIDDFVKVGKFADSNFPVKGIADIAKSYIFDTIRATTYDKYFNSNFGEDPVSALRAGAFNCWDGTNIILAIARAFGFEGSRGHGTWNGIGHVWANIPGLGIIDPTAIQNRGTFTSSAVKGYHAGGTTTRNSSTSNMNMGNTYGDVNITINNNGKDMTINEKKIDRETSKKIWNIINPSLNTGL